jgi:fatty acid desaturase
VAAAVRVDPKDFFAPEEWAILSHRSSWRGLWLVAHAWLTIVAAGVLFVIWPNPLTLLLAVMVIGARQLGLAILMHDAAHAAVHSNLKVNDWVASWLCGAPVGADLRRYRPYHLTHHKYAQQAEDPDLGLSAPFPITVLSLRRKIVRDLTGQTFFKQRIQPTIDAYRTRKSKGLTHKQVAKGLWDFWGPFIITNGAMLVVLSAIGFWWAYPALWILPMATWYPLVTRLRNIAEHACTPDNSDPLRHARTTHANPVERLLIAPYYVNYHCEHHMFMHLPSWSLPKAHRILTRKGIVSRMEVRSGYLSVIKTAASKKSGPGGDKNTPTSHRDAARQATFAAPSA